MSPRMNHRVSMRLLALLALAWTLPLYAADPAADALPEPGPARKVNIPVARDSTLPNGLRVVAVNRAVTPLVSVALYLRSGAEADPPKLARSTSQLKRATRAYKDLNLLALKLLAPGGLLVTFSCSGLVTEDLFQKVLFGAALDARGDAQIVDRLTQATDHPVLLSFPEAAYLKGLVLRAS